MAIHHKNFAETTLAAAITDTSGTSITVTSEASFPAAPFIISIDTECLLVTVVSGTTWTVTRGYENSTAATHLNGAVVYHDWSAGEADSTVHGPASATDAHLAVFDGATGKLIKDGGAVPAAGLPTTGGTMTGNLVMDNMNITLVKLLTLHGEIDDAAGGNTIDWNSGAAHKVTLGASTTLAFAGSVDATPAMTAANAPSGLVTWSSSYLSSNPGWWAYDHVITGGNNWVDLNAFPMWVVYQFPTAKTISLYSIRATAEEDRAPGTFTLQGSNNGTDWTILDTRTGITFADRERKEFTVTSPSSFTYYKLNCTANLNGSWFELSEIELETGVSDPAAPCFLTLKLVQDATGGRVVTWPATVKGSPVINQAANSISNVLFYWDGTSYWTLNGLPWVGVPSAANAAGFIGQMAYDASYIYVCTAANTWKRVAIATW